MSEKTQSPNVVNVALALAVLALGYHVVSNYSASQRPAPLEAGASRDQQDSHKVEFRLWQDPFEPFEPSTNQSSSAKSGSDSPQNIPLLSFRGQGPNLSYRIDLGSLKASSQDDYSLSNEIAEHLQGPRENVHTAIMGVMLEGGSYAEDKEARLRERYAVELALLTGELGPEDRTHISTNSITLKGDGVNKKRTSNFSYEWFESRSDAADRQVLVLWLNEYDFSDDPARRLNSLVHQIPFLTSSDKNVSFFLIGPRTSDTLRSLDSSLDTNSTDLIQAAKLAHFQILSPEATAMVHDPTNNDDLWQSSWEFSSNHITNLRYIAKSWMQHTNPLARLLWTNLSFTDQQALLNFVYPNQGKVWGNGVTKIVMGTLNDATDGKHLRQFPNLSPDEIHSIQELSSELSSHPTTNPINIAESWTQHTNSQSSFLWTNLSLATQEALSNDVASSPGNASQIVLDRLNRAIDEENFSDTNQFPLTDLPPKSTNLAPFIAGELDVRHFNCSVLEAAYPTALSTNRASDPYGRKLQRELDYKFGVTNGTHVFHPWIASDERIAELIADEVANRLVLTPIYGESNVVVILSEQDTYFGSRLADEWIDAFVGSGVCGTNTAIWQFAYLRGLDGSKPPTEKLPQKPPDLSASPEQTLQTLEEQQQNGLKSDGNAQMDYIARLGEMLRAKDREMKRNRTGRIVAVGLTGSDIYDKLFLLREMSGWLPEAVFFTSDLDAPMWTKTLLPRSRNLIVASAFPVEPNAANNSWPTLEEFPPFRDVYQAAVFRACNAVVTNLWADEPSGGDYDPSASFLKGSLWEIGWRGPVPLEPNTEHFPRSPVNPRAGFQAVAGRLLAVPLRSISYLWWKFTPIFGLLALGLIVIRLTVSSDSGIRWPGNTTEAEPDCNRQPVRCEKNPVQYAQETAADRQFPFSDIQCVTIAGLLVVLAAWLLLSWARSIAHSPGEEPWDFWNGISIWSSECLRVIIFFAGGFFLFWGMRKRVDLHRKRLWRLYFAEKEECWKEEWDALWKALKDRWHAPVNRSFFRRLLNNSVMAAWTPRFVQTVTNDKAEASVDASALFRRHLRFGRFWYRIGRALISTVLYFVIAASVMCSLRDIPTWLLVRGYGSHMFDRWALLPTIFMLLLVLFYMLDAALLTKRVLNCISLHPTLWPERPVRERAAYFSVMEEHLDGFFDVEFAAIQTQEVASRMFVPFLLLLLLVISRAPFLDNWTWPAGLIVVFVMNFTLGAACWALVRRSAQKVREFALQRIDLAKAFVKNARCDTFHIPTQESRVSKKDYLDNLDSVRQAILNEKRGAYASVFQDPSYLGVWIPSGISGIIIPLITWWLSR